MNLTAEQQAAVAHSGGHARIVAVAGAGKTATLTHYLARRTAASSAPILVLMYNRAAQLAFTARLSSVCRAGKVTPQVRTFHALGLSMYKRLIGAGLMPPSQLNPLSDAVVDLQIKQLLQRSNKARTLVETAEQLQDWTDQCRQFIALVKSEVEPAQAVAARLSLRSGGEALLLAVFTAFEQWRKEHRKITYDDMLYDPVQTLMQQPASAALFTDAFNEILVDEYQDVNPIQHFLLRQLAGSRARVTVIGDPDQTIYEFRGSSPHFITSYFARDFKSSATYCLTRTFRFGHCLALCANQLISRNKSREPLLTISADGTPQTRVSIAHCDNHGGKVADAIAALNSKGGAYGAMAVLCRLWSYIRPVELELMARAIPYRIEGEQSILHCPEIRPFLHALDLLSGEFRTHGSEQRQQLLFELLTSPSLKIPHALLRKVCARWALTILDAPLRRSFLQALPAGLSPYQQRTFDAVAAALNQLQNQKPAAAALQDYATVLDVAERLRESAANPEKGQEQARTVTAFLQFLTSVPAQTAAQLAAFLASMLTQTQSGPAPTAQGAVTLTTVHRSKGLEWPVVFLANIAEGHLPCSTTGRGARAEDERAHIESERRLMYVAITRAQKQLFITAPKTAGVVSRFIAEMNIPLSQQIGRALYQKLDQVQLAQNPSHDVHTYLGHLERTPELVVNIDPAADTTTSSAGSGKWSVGDRVQHAILGPGHIRALDEQRIHIQFDDGRTRAFVGDLALPHLSYAEQV